MSDLPPPPPAGPPPPPGGGFTPPPPPPPPGGGFVPPPPPVGYTPGAAVGYAGPRTDGLAIGALIAGILSLVCAWPLCLGVLLGPAAAIMGFISRQRVAASGGAVGGGGLALAGLILGIVGFVASAAWALIWILAIATSGSSSNSVP